MTIEEYLLPQKEAIPEWLANYKAGDKIDIAQVFSSGIVYYPGALYDGQPIKTYNQAQYAHVFLYADYQTKRDNYLWEIENRG